MNAKSTKETKITGVTLDLTLDEAEKLAHFAGFVNAIRGVNAVYEEYPSWRAPDAIKTSVLFDDLLNKLQGAGVSVSWNTK